MPEVDNSQASLLGSAATDAPDAMLVCPECRAGIHPGLLEPHLRQVHHVYQFRGVRLSFNDTFAALLDALIFDPPDAEAWRLLSSIAIENHGPRADIFLALTLGQLLKRVEPEPRNTVIDALGALIGRSGAKGLALALAADAELQTRQLALIVFASLPQPIDSALLSPLRGLLRDRRLPQESRFAALAAALRTFGDDRLLAEQLVRTLVTRRGKARSIERLRRFERVAGRHPVIDALCEELNQRLRMSCPRCSIQLRRPQMTEHLWKEHRLILEGLRVREPWLLIEEWLHAYRERQDPELLDRCRKMVRRLETEDDLRRFRRLLLAHGVADEQAHRALTEEAGHHHAACCPWCYGMVPVPREVPPFHVNLYRGRLSAGGYRVEVAENCLLSSLEIVTPEKRIYRDREPGHVLTQRGAMIVFVAPFVCLAVLWSFGIFFPTFGTEVHIRPIVPVLAVLAPALVIHLLTHWLWRPRVPASLRARNYAWTLLTPHLHEKGFSVADSAFLAGLADLSGGDGYGPLRESMLLELLKRTENARNQGVAPFGHLAALRRLMVEDAVARGADPVPLVVDMLARCFEGRFSLRFAEHLLAGWESGERPSEATAPHIHPIWWTPGNRVRLRILLCDRAFEAGFEVRNLLDAGQTAPALGRLLDTDNVANLAALRLLWSLRPTRPWDRCGDPLLVFELAGDPQRADLLGRIPDLLFWQLEPDWQVAAPGETDPGSAQIAFCIRGIFLQTVLFTETPHVVEVNARGRYNDLIIGDHRFRSTGPLDMLALRMERWFRYAFSDFLPTVSRVEKWQAPDRLAILRAWGAASCPECHRQLLPRLGQVGIALDSDRPA